MGRRPVGIAALVAAVVAVGAGGLWAIDRFGSEPAESQQETTVELTTSAVVRTDLVDRETLAGTLQYADPGAVTAQAPGTITGLPEIGAVLGRGDVAYEVDGLPVVVMFGDRPAWRPIGIGPSDDPDAAQLIDNLEAMGFALGYPYGDGFHDLPAFTTRASDLARQWQEHMGLDETGVIELGRVVFVPAPLRVAGLAVDLATPVAPGVPVLFTSAEEREVQVWLDADRQDLLTVGDGVGLVYPDDTESWGIVSEISKVVTTIGTGPDAKRVFEVSIRLEDPASAAAFDEAPVDVEVETVKAADVLAVPVNALLALAEGGYAVEVALDEGGTRLVAVDIGTFADGLVEVAGDIREGDRVVVAR